MVEPLKRPWSPISTASDTAVRALTPRRQARRLAVGAGPAVVGGDRRWPHQAGRGVRWCAPPCRRRHRRPPAHWAPCRSRGRGGHAAARRRGSGFRAPGAVIDDPAAQQHLGQAVAGPQSGRRGHRRASAPGHGPPPGNGWGPAPRRYRRCALGGPAGSRTVRSVLTRSPLGRSSLEGAATWQAIPSSARALASSKPVGPASQRRLDVPVPRPQAGDQRHDLAGITGHRPLNQPASVSVSIAAALMERA